MILALPKGLRSMPTFLKGHSKPPVMKISLRKKITDEDPNLKGYRTFKEQTKAMEKVWKEEMQQYENLLEVGGNDTKIIDDLSDLGDSEDEIEENLAAVSMGAAAAKKAHVNLEELVKAQKEAATNEGEPEDLGEAEEAPAETTEEADAAALEKAAGGEVEKDPEVDEGALPEEVKQEDLDKLLNKEAEEAAELEETSDHVEEGLHQVVEDALAVDAEGGASDDDEDEGEDEDGDGTGTGAGEESTKVI